MAFDYSTIANNAIRQLTPYQPGKPIEELERELGITSSIKLASNENPLGASKKALKAAADMLSQAHIYPDGFGYELKEALCKAYSLNMTQLTLGNGSENILELVCKTFLSDQVNAVISQYAFLTIPILIKSYNATLKVAPATNYGHDVDHILNQIDDKTRIVFIVNPNNPTGTYTRKDDFERLIKNIPENILIVVDEAYSEYITADDYPNALNYVNDYPNMIISRTFSKAYGLAGLRVGFSVSSPEIADLLNRARLPFNLNNIAAKAASVALSDQEHIKNTLDVNTKGLKQLETGLQQLNIDYIPSLGNFITLDVGHAVETYNMLLKEGVIVRPLHAYDMPRHIRVTVGTETDNKRFLESLQNIIPEIVHFNKETANG